MSGFSPIVKRAGAVRAACGAVLFGLLLAPRASPGQLPKPSPPAPANPPLTVIGLQVQRDTDRALTGTLFLPEPGTTVTLFLNWPDRALFGIDERAVAIKSFADDKGTNLLAYAKRGSGSPGTFSQVGVVTDGHRAKFVVQSPLTPAAGATKLILRGTIAGTYMTGLKTFRTEAVPLTDGTKFKVGNVELEISTPAVARNGAAARQLELRRHGSLRPVKSLRFLNGAKEIKAEQTGGGSSGFGAILSETRSFALWENPPRVTVEAEVYTQTEAVPIPVNLDVAVGLGGGGPPATRPAGR